MTSRERIMRNSTKVAQERAKEKVITKSLAIDKSIMKTFFSVMFLVVILASVYGNFYKNSLSTNARIIANNKEIIYLDSQIQMLEREIDQKLNYKSIEEQAKLQGMEYVDNLSYVK